VTRNPPEFWTDLDVLVRSTQVVIDRPAGSAHPKDARHVYPLDYGYLDGTRSSDGAGVDVWIGSLGTRDVVAIVCTIDLVKNELEMKLLLGCSSADIVAVQNFFRDLRMGCEVVKRQR